MSVQLRLVNDMLWHAPSTNLDTPPGQDRAATTPGEAPDHTHPNARDLDWAEVAIAFHSSWVVVVQGADSADLLDRESCLWRNNDAYGRWTV
jgi:hypothetical protein